MHVHRPVMVKEVIGSLNLKAGDTVLDATTGGGSHAKEILKKILPGGLLIGVDADRSALAIAGETLKDFAPSFTLVNDNFRNLDKILLGQGIKNLDAALFDLGISSYQIEDGQRGFSIKEDSHLDMRMDQRAGPTAYDIVNRYSEEELSSIIDRFGEERFHNRIAKHIVEERSKIAIETTHQLRDIIHEAVAGRYRGSRIDPATRTFQAIRIVVNDELSALEEGLKQAVSWLDLNGHVCVISFHSLEDRIVKRLFRQYAELGILGIITKKVTRPSGEEVADNPRSRSAKLRVAERT